MWKFDKNDSETKENIDHGQVVVLTARWILIFAAWVLTLWQPEPTEAWQLRTAIVLLMGYSAVNFFLTVQWANRSANLANAVYATSVFDLGLITVLVAVFGTSNIYVFYLPALLAIAVTLPRPVTALYTTVVMSAYALIVLARAGNGLDTSASQELFVRVILLAAVTFCGSLYRDIEADRREGRGRIFQVFKDLTSPGPVESAGPAAPAPEAGVERTATTSV